MENFEDNEYARYQKRLWLVFLADVFVAIGSFACLIVEAIAFGWI